MCAIRCPLSSRSAARPRAIWVTQSPVGHALTASRCTRRVWISMTKATYSRVNVTVLTWKKSIASRLLAWERRKARQESPRRPGGGTRCVRRILADGGRGDPVPEPTQLVLNARHTPGAVLVGQPQNQGDNLVANRRASRGPRLGPLPRDQPLVPAQQGARGEDTSPAKRLWQHAGQRSQFRTVGPVPSMASGSRGATRRPHGVTRATMRPSTPTSAPAAPARTRRQRRGDRSDRLARSPIIAGHGRWLSLRPAQAL